MEAWIGLISSLVLAVVGFGLGRAQHNRQRETDRDESLRQTRLETYAALCAAIIDYRRAQLHRWFAGRDIGPPEVVEQERPEIANELRRTRAGAWSQFYKVVMICDDDQLEALAREAMRLTKEMKESPDAAELDRRSDLVHEAVASFARQAGATVRSPRQRDLAPPPAWSSATA